MENKSDYILETHHLTKEFKGFVAVDDVNLKVRRGHIHALIGPNGAGKTTVFNLLTKFLTPSKGSISYNGRDITAQHSASIARDGMVRSFQISSNFPHLSLMENVRIALQTKTHLHYKFWRSDKVLNALNDRAMELLTAVDLQDFADRLAMDLPYGRKRALEIATTLAMEPEVMLLDEPTQGMGHEDVAQVVALIRRASGGRTILMVEHNLSVVADLSDRITVLQRGSILAEGSYQEVSTNPQVLEAYVGSEHV